MVVVPGGVWLHAFCPDGFVHGQYVELVHVVKRPHPVPLLEPAQEAFVALAAIFRAAILAYFSPFAKIVYQQAFLDHIPSRQMFRPAAYLSHDGVYVKLATLYQVVDDAPGVCYKLVERPL